MSRSQKREIELIELSKATSKYFGCIVDLRCQKVTSTTVCIVKCRESTFSKIIHIKHMR